MTTLDVGERMWPSASSSWSGLRDVAPGMHCAAGRPGQRQGRAVRQDARIRQLERKLTELLGERVWAESGLGAHDDIEQLQHRVTTLEQRIVELTAELDERTQDLDAARATNRELMTHLNTTPAR